MKGELLTYLVKQPVHFSVCDEYFCFVLLTNNDVDFRLNLTLIIGTTTQLICK